MSWLRALIGDDGTGAFWRRLTPDAHQVVRKAFREANDLGHPCLADEHLLLALLRHRGLDPAAARADLERIGPTLSPRPTSEQALRTLGIDADAIRHQLAETFGVEAVDQAERRVRRRPWWRGGHARPNAVCVHLPATRTFRLAARGSGPITPEHLLQAVRDNAKDTLGTSMSKKAKRQLEDLGWTEGRPNPVQLLLEHHPL